MITESVKTILGEDLTSQVEDFNPRTRVGCDSKSL